MSEGEKVVLRGVVGERYSRSEPGVRRPLLRRDNDEFLLRSSRPRSFKCFAKGSLGDVADVRRALLSVESAEVMVVSEGDKVDDSEKSEKVALNGVGKGEENCRAALGEIRGLSGPVLSCE